MTLCITTSLLCLSEEFYYLEFVMNAIFYLYCVQLCLVINRAEKPLGKFGMWYKSSEKMMV